MPNTLGHIGVQWLFMRPFCVSADMRFIMASCVIPDIPWILQRAVLAMIPGIDVYDLRAYAIVQASYAFCLILCLAISLGSRNPSRYFGIMSLGCLLHLLLDAAQKKFANGVHLAAPVSWDMLDLGAFELGDEVSFAMSLVGLAVAAGLLVSSRGLAIPRLRLQSVAIWPVLTMSFYLLLPLAFLDGPFERDNHFLRTFVMQHDRPGKRVEFDRAVVAVQGESIRITNFAGESFELLSSERIEPGSVSARGTFLDEHTILVEEFKAHPAYLRDAASIIGLVLLLLILLSGSETAISVHSLRSKN